MRHCQNKGTESGTEAEGTDKHTWLKTQQGIHKGEKLNIKQSRNQSEAY